MSILTGNDPETFAAVFLALFAAHKLGDYWVQTHAQACGKGAPGWDGRMACARHVATLTATKVIFLAGAWVVLALPLSPIPVGGALLADAASHYWADRRSTLARLAERLGKGELYHLGTPREGHDDAPHLGTGAHALDQSWHIGWLFIASLIASLGTGVAS